QSHVIEEAAMLNRAPFVFDGFAGTFQPPCHVEGDNISLEVIKKAEKEDCFIARILETRGDRACGKLLLRDGYAAVETNLIEWADGRATQSVNGAIQLKMKPFEIRTYKLVKLSCR
ncbi:MAG: glycosyl hydrolase-related protein, partial [Victivallaceae bacterium]|nr:glycosyl hydrolase-related protein [Victivallaceae bacterium]